MVRAISSGDVKNNSHTRVNSKKNGNNLYKTLCIEI